MKELEELQKEPVIGEKYLYRGDIVECVVNYSLLFCNGCLLINHMFSNGCVNCTANKRKDGIDIKIVLA